MMIWDILKIGTALVQYGVSPPVVRRRAKIRFSPVKVRL
jgi:hypothetical protein